LLERLGWLPRLSRTRFRGGGLRDGRTWREGVLSLKHRRRNESNKYHPAQQSPQENDWLPGNKNLHGRTSEDEERGLQLALNCSAKNAKLISQKSLLFVIVGDAACLRF
jgi:hypothetical protein